MALAPLVDEADLAERLGRQLTAVETVRIPKIIADASALVRNYTGREFTSRELTTRLRVDNGRIRLPQTPVTAIGHIKAINTNGSTGTAIAGWSWDGLSTLEVAAPSVIINGPSWPDNTYRVVEVRYTAGYTEVPDLIVAIVCSVALRALGQKPDETGQASESIACYSHGPISGAAAAGPLGLLEDEKAALDRNFPHVGVTWAAT